MQDGEILVFTRIENIHYIIVSYYIHVDHNEEELLYHSFACYIDC